MAKIKKQFSIALLKIGDTEFSVSSFDPINGAYSDVQTMDGTVVSNKILKKEVRDNRFICLYFEEGETTPRPEVVYDTTREQDVDNPRQINQIERDTQTFVLIDVQTQKIFISDFRKKKTLETWLGDTLDQTVLIKNVIDRAEFLNEVQSINTIYLSATPNLFSQIGMLGSELTSDFHNYGTGIRQIGLRIDFEDNRLPAQLKEKVMNLFSQKDANAIEKLVVSGRYDDKFERVFNAEGIIDKVTIDVEPREDGLFESEMIFSLLTQEVQ